MNKITVVLVIVLIICLFMKRYNVLEYNEGFNQTSGQLCITCNGKNINQCLNCFNCGFCVDEYGNSQCIGGNYLGPFNNEKCVRWYHGDPYSYMIRRNDLLKY